MKKTITICLLITVGLLGCKKEKESIEEQTTNRLQGTWEFEKSLEIYYENDIEKYRDEDKFNPNEMLFVFEGNKRQWRY